MVSWESSYGKRKPPVHWHLQDNRLCALQHKWRPRSKINSISALVTDTSGIERNAAISVILREKKKIGEISTD